MALAFRKGKFVFLLTITLMSLVKNITNPPEEEVISTSGTLAEEQ